MRLPITVIVAAILIMLPCDLWAQPSASSDEALIRQLIAQHDEGKQLPFTKDHIFWSGAYRRPTWSNDQRGEEIPTDRAPSLRVPKSQRNKTSIVRIEVAKSGDLAYEFSNTDLSFELKAGGRVTIPSSVLRVWKKVDGQWNVAAVFTHPHKRDEK